MTRVKWLNIAFQLAYKFTRSVNQRFKSDKILVDTTSNDSRIRFLDMGHHLAQEIAGGEMAYLNSEIYFQFGKFSLVSSRLLTIQNELLQGSLACLRRDISTSPSRWIVNLYIRHKQGRPF